MLNRQTDGKSRPITSILQVGGRFNVSTLQRFDVQREISASAELHAKRGP